MHQTPRTSSFNGPVLTLSLPISLFVFFLKPIFIPVLYSPLRTFSNLSRPAQTCPDLSRLVQPWPRSVQTCPTMAQTCPNLSSHGHTYLSPSQTCPDLPRPAHTCPDLSSHGHTCPDLSRLVQPWPYLPQTCSDLPRPVHTCRDLSKPV